MVLVVVLSAYWWYLSHPLRRLVLLHNYKTFKIKNDSKIIVNVLSIDEAVYIANLRGYNITKKDLKEILSKYPESFRACIMNVDRHNKNEKANI